MKQSEINQAFRNVDREIQNPELEREYAENMRFIEEQMNPDLVRQRNLNIPNDDFKRLVLNRFAGRQIPFQNTQTESEVYGGMTPNINQSKELNPFLKMITPNQSYIKQPTQSKTPLMDMIKQWELENYENDTSLRKRF